ncbi:MAG: helix-turn-helix transcriptional regulator [Elusimicrobiota bacterium]|nr:helix-turn-helix transcriptional regulator [Elusimicrobiota bacterium]
MFIFVAIFYTIGSILMIYYNNKINMENIRELYVSIGKKIREIRKLRGLTLEELADKVGRNWSFLSQIERGRSIPSIETLFLICTALEISLSDLFEKHKSIPYKINSKTDKFIWLLKDANPSEKQIITAVIKQILKKK